MFDVMCDIELQWGLPKINYAKWVMKMSDGKHDFFMDNEFLFGWSSVQQVMVVEWQLRAQLLNLRERDFSSD